MKLVDDWRSIVRKAWSIRLMVVAAVLSGFEVILPFFQDLVPRGAFAALSFAAVAGAFVARIVAQKDV